MRRAVAALALLALVPVPALAQDGRSCEPVDLAALSGWHGVWITEGSMTDINGRRPDGQMIPPVLAGFNAPWNDNGWERIEAALRANSAAGPDSQLILGWGFPAMMSSAAPFRIFISPRETVITSQYRDIRYVPTNGKGQIPEDERWPTIWGTSFGCWEGEVLVIETDSVAYTPEYNNLAPRLSEEAHFAERLRMIAPDRIENVITITDPVTLAGPWTETIIYQRHPGLDRLVHEGDMTLGNRVIRVDGELTFAPLPDDAAPPAPDFPPEIVLSTLELDRLTGTYAFDSSPLRLTVERRGNRLFMQATPGWPFGLPFYAYADGAFHSRAYPVQVRFQMDAAGVVTGFAGTGTDGLPIAGRRLQ